MSRPLPVAAVQAAPHPFDAPWRGFADGVARLVRDLPATRLVVYPELHLFGTGHVGEGRAEKLAAAAVPLDGRKLAELATLAGDLKIWLVPGSVCERGTDGQLFNTTVLLTPEGTVGASYRKIFPWRPYEPYRPGSRFVVAEMAGVGRVGLSICYDAWFPEHARHLAWMGADVIVNVVKTTTSDRPQELVLGRANAIANQVFWVSVNAAGPVGRGQSFVADPEGLVRVAAPGETATVLTDVLDLDHVTRVREFGTAAVTRPWDQFHPDDDPLPLPLYAGRIDPTRWAPTPPPPGANGTLGR